MNKWIPINEEKPPIGIPLITTVYESFKNKRELRYPVFYVKDLYSGCYKFMMINHEGICPLLPEYSEVVAWRLFPDIYESEVE